MKNSMTVAAICLAAASCSHDTDLYDPAAAEKVYAASFDNNVMNGKNIDAQQTWNTSVPVEINVTTATDGVVKVFTASPLEHLTAALNTVSMKAGVSQKITVARPQNATTLYVACIDAEGYITEQQVKADGASATVSFGSTQTAASSAKKAWKKATKHKFTSVSDIAGYEDNFVAAVPAGVERMPNGGDGSGTFFIDEEITDVNLWIGGGTIYIKGDCHPNFFYIGPGTKVCLVAGATLTLTTAQAEAIQPDEYYIASGARIVTDGTLKLNQGCKMYNRGEIEAAKLEVNGNSLLYNEGTVNVAGKLSVENNNSELVNDGDITAASLYTNGMGHVQNNGTAAISGETIINSNDNTWHNNGQYTTGTFEYTAGSSEVLNSCALKVADDMTIKLSSSSGSTLYTEGSIVTNNLTLDGPARVTMAAGALMKVNGTATMGCTLPGYGFYSEATGNDYAVLQAAEIAKMHDNQRYEVTYSGNIIVDADTHFAQGNDGAADGVYYAVENGAKMAWAETAVEYTIPEGQCSPGYGRQPAAPGPTMYYYYAFEDLGTTDDFDFNDVVLRVSAPVDGKSEICLMAAGGTLPTAVKLNNTVICNEVHSAFETGVNTMVNTTKESCDHEFITLGTASNVTDASNLNLSIIVAEGSESREISAPEKGCTPLMIKVAGDENGKWQWPTERTSISSAYSGFGEWGANYNSSTDWYKNISGKVVRY